MCECERAEGRVRTFADHLSDLMLARRITLSDGRVATCGFDRTVRILERAN